MPDVTSGLTLEQEEQLLVILDCYDGGPLSTRVFTKLAWALPQPTNETVILRELNGIVEILLIPRPPTDIVWKGMLHSPGAALRRADYLRPDGKAMNGVFERIQKGELKTSFLSEPKFVGIVDHMTPIGPEAVRVWLAEIAADADLPEGSEWYSVDQLEKMQNFIQHQLAPIKMAVKYFQNTK